MFRQILPGPIRVFLIIFFSNTYTLCFLLARDKAQDYFFCYFYDAKYNVTTVLSSPSSLLLRPQSPLKNERKNEITAQMTVRGIYF